MTVAAAADVTANAMIFGIGFDLIEVARIKKSIANDSFVKKIFTGQEAEYCLGKAVPAQSFAARFAAKEAFLKALGTGWRRGIGFNEIETVNDELGKPSLVLHGKAKEVAAELGITNLFVSLTHLKEIAGANVVLEQGSSNT